MPPARHVVLVGLMGSGKSTVGPRLARRLGRPFVDTDELVVAAAGRDVPGIFAAGGEAAFRDLERRAVADAMASPVALVVACGGGAVLDPANRRALRAGGTVVWLRATPATLAARVGTGEGRPLLAGGGPPAAVLGTLAEVRAGAYEAAAHVAVDTDGLDADAVVEEVAAALAAGAAR